MGKHIPIRECICCRRKDGKQNYCRIVKTKEGFFVDSTHKKRGQGRLYLPRAFKRSGFVKKTAAGQGVSAKSTGRRLCGAGRRSGGEGVNE